MPDATYGGGYRLQSTAVYTATGGGNINDSGNAPATGTFAIVTLCVANGTSAGNIALKGPGGTFNVVSWGTTAGNTTVSGLYIPAGYYLFGSSASGVTVNAIGSVFAA